MSGTAYGTVVLHVSPEAAIGGALALVEDGDIIELDVAGRRLHLDVPDEVLEERRKKWLQPEPATNRGYVNLYIKHVQQADKGADFDFLAGKSGSEVTRDSH
jgi:dihydroxy-acid dehydratase